MKQECIPVGCAPSAAVAVLGGVCLGGVCPGGCLPLVPSGVCPGGCLSRGRCLPLVPGGSLPRGDVCLWSQEGVCLWSLGCIYQTPPLNRITERCTNITLRNYVAAGNKTLGHYFSENIPLGAFHDIHHPVWRQFMELYIISNKSISRKDNR